ncbi:hypothetical protein WN51_10213 [Melipona quadrifasciata]|uniref:Uncharacterized protein n=1 Tax=Melipona quadrifasciata TaxID=166423 RepID=A0A0M9A6U4_9HYME|nr:hypothetical protein WN51_10213 [Melipona quadrifasciata]
MNVDLVLVVSVDCNGLLSISGECTCSLAVGLSVTRALGKVKRDIKIYAFTNKGITPLEIMGPSEPVSSTATDVAVASLKRSQSSNEKQLVEKNVEQDHDEATNRKLTGPPNKREEPEVRSTCTNASSLILFLTFDIFLRSLSKPETDYLLKKSIYLAPVYLQFPGGTDQRVSSRPEEEGTLKARISTLTVKDEYEQIPTCFKSVQKLQFRATKLYIYEALSSNLNSYQNRLAGNYVYEGVKGCCVEGPMEGISVELILLKNSISEFRLLELSQELQDPIVRHRPSVYLRNQSSVISSHSLESDKPSFLNSVEAIRLSARLEFMEFVSFHWYKCTNCVNVPTVVEESLLNNERKLRSEIALTAIYLVQHHRRIQKKNLYDLTHFTSHTYVHPYTHNQREMADGVCGIALSQFIVKLYVRGVDVLKRYLQEGLRKLAPGLWEHHRTVDVVRFCGWKT